MKKEKIYTLLSRSRQLTIAFGGNYSLWLGPDHLLHATKSTIAEDYRRLFFKDIQGITIAQTNVWLVSIFVYALFLLGGIALIVSQLLFPGDIARLYFGVFFSVVALLMILRKLWLGPSCICHFHTVVQQENIQAIGYMKKAKKVLARILPLIEAAQGSLQSERLEALASSQRALRLAEKTSKPEKPFRHSLAKYHAAFYIMLLLDSASCFMDMFVSSSVRDFFGLVVTVLLFIAGTMAVIDQRRTFIHLGLQRFTLFSLVFQFVMMFAALIVSTTYAMIMASRGHALSGMEEFRNSDVFLSLLVLNGVTSLLLAVLGLMRLNTYLTALKKAKVQTEAQVPDGA